MVNTPHAPKVDSATFDKDLETEGELDAKQCASHFMGNLYVARMAHPGVSVAITLLAAHITKWNKECGRQLERLFSYLDSSSDLALSDCLSEEFAPHAVLRSGPMPTSMAMSFIPSPPLGVGLSSPDWLGGCFLWLGLPRNSTAPLVLPRRPRQFPWRWERVNKRFLYRDCVSLIKIVL